MRQGSGERRAHHEERPASEQDQCRQVAGLLRCDVRPVPTVTGVQLPPQCQVLGQEPSTGTTPAQDQTPPEAEPGPCSYQIGACRHTDNLLISWMDRILANRSLLVLSICKSRENHRPLGLRNLEIFPSGQASEQESQLYPTRAPHVHTRAIPKFDSHT